MGRIVHRGLGSSSLIAHVLRTTILLSPREQLCNRYCSNKHTVPHYGLLDRVTAYMAEARCRTSGGLSPDSDGRLAGWYRFQSSGRPAYPLASTKLLCFRSSSLSLSYHDVIIIIDTETLPVVQPCDKVPGAPNPGLLLPSALTLTPAVQPTPSLFGCHSQRRGDP